MEMRSSMPWKRASSSGVMMAGKRAVAGNPLAAEEARVSGPRRQHGRGDAVRDQSLHHGCQRLEEFRVYVRDGGGGGGLRDLDLHAAVVNQSSQRLQKSIFGSVGQQANPEWPRPDRG